MLQIGRKLKKWRWRHNFSTCVIVNIFWRCIVSLFRFGYWSKFHVNMVTRSGVMIISISFYKGLTRNLEIGNTPSEFCPISEDWGELGIPNLARTSLIKCYWMLQNARVTWLRMSKLNNLNNCCSSELILDNFGLSTEIFVSTNNPLHM